MTTHSKSIDTQKTRRKICIRNKNLVFIDSATNFEAHFPIRTVTEEQILQFREEEAARCIIKVKGLCGIADVPKNIILSNINCKSLCSSCKRCLALKDPNKGCPKINELSMEDNWDPRFTFTIEESRRIEKYAFIRTGIETLGIKENIFVVFNCTNYIPDSPKISTPVSPAQPNAVTKIKQPEQTPNRKENIETEQPSVLQQSKSTDIKKTSHNTVQNDALFEQFQLAIAKNSKKKRLS